MKDEIDRARSVNEALAFAREKGLPIEIKSSFGLTPHFLIARSLDEVETMAQEALNRSPVHEIGLFQVTAPEL
jgi:carbamoylphosphate synthase large subunit